MSISRRDFMKLVGISVASLSLTRCRSQTGATCYIPMPPTKFPLTAKDRLRSCWLSFGELAQATINESNEGTSENTFGTQLVADHNQALDEMVSSNELAAAVAELVKEAYAAAVYHVWRSNALITCYEPMLVNYAPVSAAVLVEQSAALSEIASQDIIDPQTLAKARAALEHDMAYYAMTDEEVASLYDRLLAEWQSRQQSTPAFEELDLEITPDAKAAAQFIISLLTGK
jgi:hypothetical protein